MHTHSKLLYRLFITIAVVMTVALAGCTRADEGQTFTYALDAEITSLDPIRATEDQPRLITTQVLETLVTYDEDLQLQPLLAESWERSDDARRWTFHLRPNVYFHEDDAFGGAARTVNAEDVVYSITRVVRDSISLGAWILSDVLAGLGEDSTSALGARAQDSLTVVFDLRKPYAQFPARLALPFTAVVPREVVEARGDAFATHPIGTGPFQIAGSASSTDRVELVRNPRYWRDLDTNVDRVVFQTARANQTILADFLQGQVDAFELRPAAADQVLETGELNARFESAQLLQVPLLKVHFVGFNFNDEINRDLDFRRAVNFAVNKEELTEQVLNGLAVPSTGPLPSGITGATDSMLYSYDPERARALLDQSGYEGQPIAYITDNSSESVAVAEYLERRLGEFGVNLQIDTNPEPVWVDRLVKGDFDWGKLYFSLDYPAPDNPMAQFLSSNAAPAGPNFGHYSSAAFDTLYTRALREVDTERAAELYERMNSLVRADAPWLFLYRPTRTIVVRDGVEGIEVNPLSFSLFLDEIQVGD